MAKMQENTDRESGTDLRRDPQRVHGALGAAVDRARARVGPRRRIRSSSRARSHGPRDLIAVYRDARQTHDPAAAPRPHRGRHGRQGRGLVGLRAGRAAQRGHRRHDPRVAHAPPGRRPSRGGLRRVRDSAGARPALVRADHHGLSGLRADDVDHVPGAGRAHPGLRPRADAGLEDAPSGRRDHDSCRHGLRRQRPWRIEGGQHRHLAAGHRRGAQLSGLRRRRARDHAARHLRRAGRGLSEARRRLRRAARIRLPYAPRGEPKLAPRCGSCGSGQGPLRRATGPFESS